jgi:hypothetical protein
MQKCSAFIRRRLDTKRRKIFFCQEQKAKAKAKAKEYENENSRKTLFPVFLHFQLDNERNCFSLSSKSLKNN